MARVSNVEEAEKLQGFVCRSTVVPATTGPSSLQRLETERRYKVVADGEAAILRVG